MRYFLKYLPIVIFLLALFLFTYKLSFTALQSYDEAWYAEIAKNLVITKNPFQLEFNQAPFIDHPPLGYIWMAISASIFGSNEFSARLVSALMGSGAVLIIYLIGKDFKNWQTGLAASSILISSLWFVLRARSGNLDVQFIFWELLVIWILLSKLKNWHILSAISFSALILTKTTAWMGMLPVIVYLLWKKRISTTKLKHFLSVIFILVSPWYIYHFFNTPDFLVHHFFKIGAKGTDNKFSVEAIMKNLEYLAYGVGKWFKPFMISILLSFTYIFHKKESNKKSLNSFSTIGIWLIGFSIFIFSNKTEIWHLLPLYPGISLIIPLAVFEFLELPAFKKFSNILQNIVLLFIIFIAIFQYNQLSSLIYPNSPIQSDEREISLAAQKYDQIYLLDTFYPSLVYYSGSHVVPLHLDPQAFQKVEILLTENQSNVLLINHQYQEMLDKDDISYQVLNKNSSYLLISNSPLML